MIELTKLIKQFCRRRYVSEFEAASLFSAVESSMRSTDAMRRHIEVVAKLYSDGSFTESQRLAYRATARSFLKLEKLKAKLERRLNVQGIKDVPTSR